MSNVRQYVTIKAKFGEYEYTVGVLLHAKSGPDRLIPKVPALVKIAVFGSFSPRSPEQQMKVNFGEEEHAVGSPSDAKFGK